MPYSSEHINIIFQNMRKGLLYLVIVFCFLFSNSSRKLLLRKIILRLFFKHLGIFAAARHKLGVCTGLDKLALVH